MHFRSGPTGRIVAGLTSDNIHLLSCWHLLAYDTVGGRAVGTPLSLATIHAGALADVPAAASPARILS